MKRMIAGMSLLMLGTVLAVGCGGAPEQPVESPPASAQIPAPDNASTPTDAQLPSWNPTPPGDVKAQDACCYVKCSKWHGPFHGVDYKNCTNFGRYWCPQQEGGAFSDAKWDNC